MSQKAQGLRFGRSDYVENLMRRWIPALDGVEAKLRGGASIADVGCGRGAHTIIMARTYPASRFVGFDYVEGAIFEARQAAVGAGVADRCRFDVATAKDFQDGGYDLVIMFDPLHDLGDPVGAATHVRDTLAPDGTWMIVAPLAGGRLENMTACLPYSRFQEVDAALREVVSAGGYTRFRRVAATPYHLVVEVRP